MSASKSKPKDTLITEYAVFKRRKLTTRSGGSATWYQYWDGPHATLSEARSHQRRFYAGRGYIVGSLYSGFKKRAK